MRLKNLTYKVDREIEDKFAPIIKNILGNIFISKEEIDDLEKATDFAIYHIQPFSVAVRLRRFEYFPTFHNQFTIRWRRPSGVRTEIDKIRDKEVEYLFYGFLSPTQDFIIQYFIADLKQFQNQEPMRIFPNNPHDSDLAIYHINQFPASFIVKFYCHPEYEKMKR